MNNILSSDLSKCTGCRACEQICPKSCITMINNEQGFLMPSVRLDNCIGCGICQKSCTIHYQSLPRNEINQVAYAVKNRDNLVLKNSSSGGIFYELACEVINKGGYVYGCCFNDKLEAHHIEISRLDEIKKLQGSKYVQSDTKNTYRCVQNRLVNDSYVLYVGTACQIQGLKSYLKKAYDKLITVDVICHGVPSPLLFKKYIKWLSDKYGGTITEYNFRSKKRGWGLTSEVKLNNKSKYIDALIDPYYKAFLDCKTYRECCYTCSFTHSVRVSDLTLGDFWGVEKYHPKFYSDKGVSAILINSKNGESIFNAIKDNFDYISTTFDNIAERNSNLLKPSERPDCRDSIYNDMLSLDFNQLIKKDLLYNISISRCIKLYVPTCIKRVIRSVKVKLIR